MGRPLIFVAAISLSLLLGCAGSNTIITTKNIETAAAVDSAFVPGAAIIGAPLVIVDAVKYFASVGKPKAPKISQGIWGKIKCTPSIFGSDDKGNPKWGKYAICRENGKVQRIKLADVPQLNLNYRLAYLHAFFTIEKGVLSDGDKGLLQRNLETWGNGGLLAIEYHGPEGATVVAVSNKNEPFEIMLPEEWEQRKSRYGLTPVRPVVPVDGKTEEGNHP